MKKGITPVVSIILLLIISVVIVGLASGFIQRIVGIAGSSAESQTTSAAQSSQKTVSVDGASTTSVVVRAGTVAIPTSEVAVFVDNATADCTWSANPIPAQGTSTCTLTSCTGKFVYVTSPGTSKSATVKCA